MLGASTCQAARPLPWGCSGAHPRANGTLMGRLQGWPGDSLGRWPACTCLPASAGLWGHVAEPSDPVCG